MSLDIVNKAHLIRMNKLLKLHHKDIENQLTTEYLGDVKISIAILQEHR